MKCDCPNEGKLGCPPSRYDAETELPFVNHEPGKCKCVNNILRYQRGGDLLNLCSICTLPEDILALHG